MSVRFRRVLILAVILVVCVLAGRAVFAQSDGEQYFPQTGHRVSQDFLTFYQKNPDSLLVYGYPITEPFLDQTTGKVVQYFQRARFEFHPEVPQALQVQITPLGEYLYKPGEAAPIQDNPSPCKTFLEAGKGYQVCYAFLDFFNQHGGVAQFGYPISNLEVRNDRRVQYFQRARFEWHPENPSGQRVVLGDLGREYFDAQGENPARLNPSQDNNAPISILSLQAHAYVKKPVTTLEGEQTIYVVVQDQTYRPVENAQVTLFVFKPGGGIGDYLLEPVKATPTNRVGVTRYTFQFKSDSRGLAKVGVAVSYEGLQTWTTTSFRIWW